MKNTLLFFALTLATISCKGQTTYNNQKLEIQSVALKQFQTAKKSSNKTPLTIGMIVNELQVKPLSFSFDHSNPDTNMVNQIILKFYNSKDLNFISENNMNIYNIVLVLKKEIKRSEVAQVFLDNKKVWNTNVYNYLKDLEITEVVTNDK